MPTIKNREKKSKFGEMIIFPLPLQIWIQAIII
jgi:hypothetical protein